MDILHCSFVGDVFVEGAGDVVAGVQNLVHSHASCCGRGSRVIHGVEPGPLVRVPARAWSVDVLFVICSREKKSYE